MEFLETIQQTKPTSNLQIRGHMIRIIFNTDAQERHKTKIVGKRYESLTQIQQVHDFLRRVAVARFRTLAGQDYT